MTTRSPSNTHNREPRETAAPGLTHTEIFGPSQAELFGPPTSRTYRGRRGRRPYRVSLGGLLPAWYLTRCEAWSRALARDLVTTSEAARVLDLWHPIALRHACRTADQTEADEKTIFADCQALVETGDACWQTPRRS